MTPADALVADSLESADLIAAELRRAGLVVGTAPRALPGGVRAVSPHAEAAVAEVLGRWRAARRPRTVLLAQPQSFCAGVERAVQIVEAALARYPHPVYVRKQIVHNTHVVRDLAERGAVFVDDLDEVPEGALVVFSAHGVSPAVRAQARRRGLRVIDATCPLVTKVHAEVRRFAARGDDIVLIGHAGHEESEGTLGEAPGRTTLVRTVDDVARLPAYEGGTAYVMQTTLAVDEAAEVVAALRERFPGIKGPGSDDICYATTNRQEAVRAVAAESDLLFVIGSPNSSNSLRLAELSERAGTPTRFVEDVGDVRLADLAEAARIGLTAGASAPPALVDGVIRNLRGLGPVEVVERRVAVETTTFNLPKELAAR
ncbi:4-hydroxy-3-methylbut-2-enyl diphosphate reductase [Microbispora sp. NPDC088329]|uniref:4-hydroxy-3-methylbut-2-enyl diphosphate reductase n=1 Tax=Microbispora sp. NPDC088329 TaxID=3154869 RepID=UPI003435D1E2